MAKQVCLIALLVCLPFLSALSLSENKQDLKEKTKRDEGCLCLERLATRMRNPLLLVYPDDNTGRLFVGEQLGLVYIFYKDGRNISEPFLNLTDLILTSGNPGDERGFLGMVFHPSFAFNQRFYVYFSHGTGGLLSNRLSEFTTDPANRNKVDRSSERVIMEFPQPFPNHNGGQLLFGSDNYLYVTTGDGGGAGDPFGNALNLNNVLGKVLRIDVDSRTGQLPYGIPPTNPFVSSSTARHEVYAYGARNMWRCSFDRGDIETGAGKDRLFCGDVGQNRFEEVDIVESGKNYGWNSREGFECYNNSPLCGNIGPEVLPIHAYGRTVGQSITGGYVFRGCQYGEFNGLYIFGDYGSGRLFRLKDVGTSIWEDRDIVMCAPNVCTNGLLNTFERRILSFGEDWDGDVYLLATSQADTTSASGSVYRFVDPNPGPCSAKKGN